MQEANHTRATEYRMYAEAFQEKGVVDAYRYRPAYPLEVFATLTGLINGEPRHILDIGCGTGDIARFLVTSAERVDAVDASQEMIEQGKRLPQGDHPQLRWLHGRIEEVTLAPPYALITAGESLHWMDWQVVMPRFHEVLMQGGYLAIVERRTTPDPWSILSEILPRYRTDRYQSSGEQEHQLLQKVGEHLTTPIFFLQTIDEYVESYHSRAGFSREHMGAAQAAAFDQESRAYLLKSYPAGVIPFQVSASIVWGIPQAK
ncbi:MAG TPA: class I SAM-dependent methyltransferase [Ktedonobacteraceae bacterium]